MLKQPDHSQIYQLTPEQALTTAGIPVQFSMHLLQTSQLGVSCSFRMGCPYQLFDEPSAPKPMAMKAKTSNWGPVKGVIPVSHHLGRLEKNGSMITYQEHELPPVHQRATTQHKIALRDLHQYKMLTTSQQIAQSGQLQFKLMNDDPHINSIIFSINLNDNHIVPSRLNDSFHYQTPAWWNNQWGDFSTRINDRYPIFFQEAHATTPEPLQVFAINDEKGHALPITSDLDLLWMSRPQKLFTALENIDHAFTPIDTHTAEGPIRMIEILWQIDQTISQHNQTDPQFATINAIPDHIIAGLGTITPFEAYMTMQANKAFANNVEHVKNLIQHGAENRNPGKLSDINAPMIHFWQNNIIVTQDEASLVKFLLQTTYLETNRIDVHHHWNMKLWAPVVSRQLELNQPIPKQTFLAYSNFMDKKREIKYNRKIQHQQTFFQQKPSLPKIQRTQPMKLESKKVIIGNKLPSITKRRNH